MPPASTVEEAMARLEQIDRTLRPSDGVRWFNRLYLEVTLAVAEYLTEVSLEAPPFLERLSVFFANAYFAAFDAAGGGEGGIARAWAPIFEARGDRRTAPLQFALAGMNAHINHDLAMGVVATCQALGMRPGDPQHRDYESVNAILRDTEERVKAWLLTGAVKELDHLVAPAGDLAAIWSVTRARDAAWVRAQVLWQLRDDHDLTAAYLDVNDRATELAGRAMLLPLPLA